MLQIGQKKASFVPTSDLGYKNAADQFRLAGTGDDGAAGFSKCDADYELIADGYNTLLHYSARVETDG